jgi:hypothetical protein
MMARLQLCFGWSGALSALAWAAAFALCLIALQRNRRRVHASGQAGAPLFTAAHGTQRPFAVALVLALVALALTAVHTGRINATRLDRSDEVAEARAAQARLQAQEEQARLASGERLVRFAEDAPGDTVDTVTAAPPIIPAYQAAGKQTRAAGKVQADAAARTQAVLRNLDDAAPGVSLKLPDYRLAQQLARLNKLAARATLLIILGVIVGGYLRRFNAPLVGAFPLPLAGPWVDGVSVKTPLVIEGRPPSGQVAALLESVLRKGQSFIYIGNRVAASDVDSRRLRLLRWGAWSMPLLTVRPADAVPGAGGAATPCDPEFVLDAVWFGRHAVFVSAAAGAEMLSGLADRLTERVATRAAARRLPHIVVDGDVTIPAEVWARLKVLGPETGLRLVRVVGES